MTDETQPPKLDYYTTVGRRILDFLGGFFGSYVLAVLASLFINIMASVDRSGVGVIVWLVLFFVLLIALIVASFMKGRRYLAIGIIAAILIPLIVFGACLLIFAGMFG